MKLQALFIYSIIFIKFYFLYISYVNYMILGSKRHAFHAYMKKYDFGTRKTPKT